MTFSPISDLLITTHVGRLGFYEWVNRAYYSNLAIRPVQKVPEELDLPNVTSEKVDEEEPKPEIISRIMKQQGNKKDQEKEDDEESDEDEDTQKPEAKTDHSESMELESVETISQPGLITLSNLPKLKWKNLPDWDTIKERNKPIEPPTKPSKAPFFLPTVSGLEPHFVIQDEADKERPEKGSRIMKMAEEMEAKSKFIVMLTECDQSGNYTSAFNELTSMSPSGIDYEIRGLSLQNDYLEVKMFMKMIHSLLISDLNFEVVQSLLSVFLKIHGDLIPKEPELTKLSEKIKKKQEQAWNRLQNMFHNSLCLIRFFSGIQLT